MTHDPVRLQDDAGTSSAVADALRGFGSSPSLPPDVFSRSQRKVAFMAAFPAVFAGIFASKAATAAVLAVSLVAVATTGALVLHERTASSVSTVSPAAYVTEAHAPPIVTISAPIETSTVAELPSVAPQDAPSRGLPTPKEAPTHPVASAPIAEQADSLEQEVRLLQEAKALVRTNPEGALQKTREHASRFPKGTLSLEREMVAIEALVAGGNVHSAQNRAKALRPLVRGTIYAARLDALVPESK